MGLDISKITNAELQKLANIQDKNNNKILDSAEFELFKEKAAKKEGISAEDFNQAMGLYKTEAAQTTVATVQTAVPTRKEKRAARKDLNARRNDIEKDIQALIEGKKSARLRKDEGITLNNLVKRLSEKNENSEYAGIIADVQAVVAFANSTKFNSKEEVKALEKRIKKNDKFNDFQKGLAEQIVELAKREQINKEAEVLVGIYDAIKADKNNAENYTAYLKKVKTEMDNRGLKNVSYYSDEAFEKLESVVKQDAVDAANKKREQMVKDGAEFDSEKKVKKALENKTPETDKISRKAIKNGKDMNGVTARWLDRDRRAEELEKITEEELKDELGEKLFNILNRSYLDKKKNSDGSYNVRELSDALFEKVGYDVWMNMSDDTPMSELQGAKNELKYLTGRDLKDKDIKKIMKLVHIEKEPKNRNLLDAVKKSIIPGIAGAIAGFSADSRLHVTQKVQINMESTSAKNMLAELEAAGITPTTIANSDGTITVTILQEVLKDTRALSALAGAGIGVLTGTLMNLIVGMENNEKSCFSIADFDLTNERYTNIDNYKDYVRKTEANSKRADLICALADTMHKQYGDDWAKQYDSMLKKFAGRGSVLNCLEFRSGVLFGVTDQKKPEQTTTTPTTSTTPTTQTTTETEKDHTYSTNQKDAVEATYEDVPAIDGSTTEWKKIARQYDCLVEKYTLNGAIRILKIAQAINNGDYSAENLDKLYKLSLKGPSQLKNIEGLDYQKFYDTYKATYLPALEYDKNGKPIKGTGVKVPAQLGDCTRNAELSLKAGRLPQAKNVVKPTGHAADRRKISDGSEAVYYARFDNGPVLTYTEKEKRDIAVRAFKDKYPNAKAQSWEK